MQGSELRLKRLIPDGGNIIILPIDHGEFQGPRQGTHQRARHPGRPDRL